MTVPPILFVWVLIVGACAPFGRPAPPLSQMQADVAHLESVVPVLEGLQVVSWSRTDTCHSIDYPRGNFQVDMAQDGSCYVSDKPSSAFDDEATADFERVASAIDASGVDVDRIGFLTYHDDGRLRSGDFPIPPCFSYTFDRDGETLAKDTTPQLVRVTRDWFFWGADPDWFC